MLLDIAIDMGGRFKVKSAFLRGVEAVPVDVEVVVSDGIPGFSIVGLADASVLESRERVKAAIKASGFAMPNERIIINLAPSAMKKNGSGFDLAIAVALLAATNQVPKEAKLIAESLFVGELSLDGNVRAVPGMLAYAICARDLGISMVGANSADLLVAIDGLKRFSVRSLSDFHSGNMDEVSPKAKPLFQKELDYREVSGNEVAKRALQIAAAGGHGLLMMGPPGSGKTMLAARLPSILPPLENDERLQVALIHSVAGEDIAPLLRGARPFRAPHHSATAAGLIGGGTPVRPGEITLAHKGVLFCDELTEFKPSVLQMMRQPMESGKVVVTRADGNIEFPARFQFIAATNPCPCGFFGDPEIRCGCTEAQVRSYQNRIGGPLIDRIDLHIDVARVDPAKVINADGGTSSKDLKEGVLAAREFASWRKARFGKPKTSHEIVESCRMSDEDALFFEKAARVGNMSGRAIVSTLSVARTIADLAQKECVGRNEVSEAIGYRVREEVGKI